MSKVQRAALAITAAAKEDTKFRDTQDEAQVRAYAISNTQAGRTSDLTQAGGTFAPLLTQSSLGGLGRFTGARF